MGRARRQSGKTPSKTGSDRAGDDEGGSRAAEGPGHAARGKKKRVEQNGAAKAREEGRKQLAAEPIFVSLAGAILRGKFTPGNPLPPERELSALFNVSRLIARQALHRLREIGLVSGGQGGQNTVLDPDDSADPRLVELTIQYAPKASDARGVVDRQVLGGLSLLELAAHRATEAQLDALERLLTEARAPGAMPETGPDDFEAKWWCGLAEATQNRVLLRETRWWFGILSKQSDRWLKGGFGATELQFRIGFYQALLDRIRRGEDVAGFYLSVVRPLLHAQDSAQP